MYDIHNAPVFQKTFDLLKKFHATRNKLPKTEKYALGEQIEGALLTTLLAIMEAGRTKKHLKLTPLDRAIAANDKTQVLIRLLFEIGLANEKEYLGFSEQIQQIGRMLGGWQRSL